MKTFNWFDYFILSFLWFSFVFLVVITFILIVIYRVLDLIVELLHDTTAFLIKTLTLTRKQIVKRG